MAEDPNHHYYDDTGGVPWDSQLATIGGKEFILENIDFTEPSAFNGSNGISGAPRAGKDIAGLITARATAQFSAGSTLADTPKRFAEVTLKYRNVDKVFIITEPGTAQRVGMEIKCSLSLRERLNAPAGNGN